MPANWVPASFFWLTDGSRVLGTARLRHGLNEWLLNEGGHIGYDIHPLHRKQGYGAEILRLMLEEAKKLGLSKVLVTCGAGNEGSRKIIEKNGGIFENSYINREGIGVYRFWIDIACI